MTCETKYQGIQDKTVKIMVIPTWVTLTLKERKLPLRSITDPETRTKLFSKEELHMLQAANRAEILPAVLTGCSYPNVLDPLLYRFDDITDLRAVDALVARTISEKTQTDILFGAQLPEDHYLDATCEIVDDDDHVDVLVFLFAKHIDDIKMSPSISKTEINIFKYRHVAENNLAKVSDALYVRNFPLVDLISMGLFRI